MNFSSRLKPRQRGSFSGVAASHWCSVGGPWAATVPAAQAVSNRAANILVMYRMGLGSRRK